MAAAEGVRKRMCWQRLSMVGSSRARSWQTSTKTAYSGGSSSDFSSALAASRPIVSASRIRYARRGASNGRRCRSLRSSRIWSIRIASPSGSTTYRSGCCSVSTRCSSVPSTSAMKAWAASSLPEPRGPYSRYAWLGSAAASASRRPASGCPNGSRTERRPDPVGDGRHVGVGVDGRDALRLVRRDGGEGRGHRRAEPVSLALDPVGLGRLPRGGDEDDRAVRQQPVGGEQADVADRRRGRDRARRPGRRRTSRCSGRRSPRRRGPAPARSRRPPAGRGWRRTAAPRRAGRHPSRRGRAPATARARPAVCRRARGTRPPRGRRHADAPPGGGPASTCRRRRGPRGRRTSHEG